MKKLKGRKPDSLVRVAIHYQDTPILVREIFLFLFSFLCSACNVLSPLLEKWILDHFLDVSAKNYTLLFILITLAGYILLGIANVLNIQIFYRFRFIRENERILSLSEKDPEIIHKEGAGAYSSAVFGDSEQISKVVAANWFLILFNLISAIASRVISAVFSRYFLVISLVGYILILACIVICTKLSIAYYRKGKEDGYSLSPKIRELVDDRNTILSYTTRNAYQRRVRKYFLKRDNNQRMSDEIDTIEDVSIKGIQALCSAIFLFVGIRQMNPSSSLYSPSFDYPTFVALASYFATIFLPVSYLSSTFKNRMVFHAFYSRVKEIVSCEPIGSIPEDNILSFDKVTIDEHPEDRDVEPLMLNFSYEVKGKTGFYRKDPVLQQKFRQRMEEDIRPSGGFIRIGGCELKDIRKSLVRGRVRFPSTLNDIFFDGFQFNITLGKPLLSDEDYDRIEKEYCQGRIDFINRRRDGSLFQRKYRKRLSLYLRDILGMDIDAVKGSEERAALIKAFSSVDPVSFSEKRGPCLFSREYARQSRYDALLKELDRKDLRNKKFGPKGKNLTIDEKKKILLARFFLPENDAFLILNDNRILSDKKHFANLFSSFVTSPSYIILSSNLSLLKQRTETVISLPNRPEKGKKSD